MTKKYRPANGSEGEIFHNHFCNRCQKDRYESRPCSILNRTLMLDVTDKKYPKQWVTDNNGGNPRCTSFKPREERPSASSGKIRDRRQELLPI